MKDPQNYYVPDQSWWPIIGAVGLFTLAVGGGTMFLDNPHGKWIFMVGALIIASMMYGWFSHVIQESRQGLYSPQMDRSFRWGMSWFIFSEVMFFGAFFAALFYSRHFSLRWLAGFGDKQVTHELWPHFHKAWPLLINPNPEKFNTIKEAMAPWGLASINTALLLTSGLTITIAHHALRANKRMILNIFLGLTIVLGIVFLIVQGVEYHHAYHEQALTLKSGIYGATFFMLTGFHGAHVTIGALMLFILWLRCLRGHFTPDHHFAFEAAAWYWHFVDVVWLILFVCVYWF